MRTAGNTSWKADWERAKAELERQAYKFSVFGGEPLLTPFEQLEEIFKFGYERFGRNGIQTNGTLVTDEHIRLFKDYSVGVGISCDGPGRLSDLRRDGSLDSTRVATDATIHAIERLVQSGIIPSIIVTVHRLNGKIEHRDEMRAFFKWLEDIGITDVNLHMLEVEPGMESLALSEPENVGFFYDVYQWSKTSKIRFQPFRDIRRQLVGEELDKLSCIWNACDPLTTNAVSGVSRSGGRRNCGRTNKDGVNWVKADTPGKERYFVLYNTPQQDGGCKDCRFFAFCKGNCPGTAIDGDWRNRSSHCQTWFQLFSAVERDLIDEKRLPRSKDSAKLGELVNHLLNVSKPSNYHGDEHTDTPHIDSDDRGVAVTWLNG